MHRRVAVAIFAHRRAAVGKVRHRTPAVDPAPSRASEAATARLGDVDAHGGHRVLWVRGKGETETNQHVPLNAPTATALERWLPVRAAISVPEGLLAALAVPEPLDPVCAL